MQLFGWEKEKSGRIHIRLSSYGENGQPLPVRQESVNGQTRIVVCGKESMFRDELVLKKAENGYVARRTFTNLSEKNILLKELEVKVSGIDFGKDAGEDYFYSNENARIYGTFTLPLDYDRVTCKETERVKTNTEWADPGVTGNRIGASPYQPFPAVLISNYKSKYGLVHGSLSQDIFFHNYEAGHDSEGAFLKVFSSFKAISYRIVRPGESLEDRWYLGITDRAGDINEIFGGYTAELRKRLKPIKNSPSRRTFVWGSWNDGVYRNVSEELLLEQAESLKKYFPQVKWLQLDDGYTSFCDENPDRGAHGLGAAYEGEEGTDKKKFPHGLDGFTENVKARGLRPAVWIGGLCPKDTRICKEHPQWFIDYSSRIPDSSPLDVSIPQVRQYISYALDKFFAEDGFEGVKLDFWTYAFEDSHDLLKNKDRSGYEYRKWWLEEIRKRLPKGGYMESGCDIGAGNPFLGEWFDNYRYGLDVGSGDWNKVKITMFWGTACISTRVGDLIVPNSDAVGLMNGLNDTDFLFLLNYVLATGSMVELSGIFGEESNKNRIALLRRAAEMAYNGADVRYVQFDYRRQGIVMPKIIRCEGMQSAESTQGDRMIRIGVFNAEDEPTEICFTAQEAGIPAECVFTDWCSGKKTAVAGTYSCILGPHESRLYCVRA